MLPTTLSDSMDTAAFITFGCKINQYETEAIREQVLALGYEEVDPSARADLYVVNTCSVTAEGFAKSRRSILRAARANSEGRIVVVGCSTPGEKRSLEGIPQVALVAGNEEKDLVASFIAGEWHPGEPRPPRLRGPWALRISRFSERTRASVKVQDGCNSFCSFCIIPFLRGRSRSRPVGAVVEEVRRLVDGGYREIVISGVHVQHYGEDAVEGTTLAGLLRRVADVPGLLRVRLSSLGVRAFTPELMDALENPLFCPHWHLPLQAGSDRTLERMRRDYRVRDFLAVVESLRARFPDPSFSTDVVVGFPGEREEDFSETLRVARRVGFSKMHIFPYSRREGTLASKLGGDLPPAVIRRRARTLRTLEEELSLAYKERFVGRRVGVLVEGRARPLPGRAGAGGTGSVRSVPRGEEDGTEPVPPRGSAGGTGSVRSVPLGEEDGTEPVPPRGSAGGTGSVRSSGDPRDVPWLEGFTDRYVRVRFPEPRPGGLERLRGTLAAVRVRAVEAAVAWGELAVAREEPRGPYAERKGTWAEPKGARTGEGA